MPSIAAAATLQVAVHAYVLLPDHVHLLATPRSAQALGQLDNTIFIAMSDNGASQEGGATGVMDGMRYYNGLREDVDVAMARLDAAGGPESQVVHVAGLVLKSQARSRARGAGLQGIFRRHP